MNNTDSSSPEQIASENELICQKLLGWITIPPGRPLEGIDFIGWRRPSGGEQLNTPSFTTWAEAGLILDTLMARGCDYDIESTITDEGPRCTVRLFDVRSGRYVRSLRRDCAGYPMPAIRAIALEFSRSWS